MSVLNLKENIKIKVLISRVPIGSVFEYFVNYSLLIEIDYSLL